MDKRIIISLFGLTILLIAIFGIIFVIYSSQNVKKSWSGTDLIGHAFYEVDGNIYTNSLEAFEAGYKNGLRTFEVDFLITSDNKLVCVHSWDGGLQEGISSNNIPDEKTFLSTKILNLYTPLSFKDLLLLLKKYPDIWIVTDTKYTDQENITLGFNLMLQEADELNSRKLLDRFIVQIYNEQMYDIVDNIYSFPNILFTLYKYQWNGTTESFKQAVDFSKRHKNIKAITMWNVWFTDELYNIVHDAGLDVYVHTENNAQAIKNFIASGARGAYTDNIGMDDLK